ncbi:Schwann cell myelin protein-like [Acanthopagrus schlegelii]
MVIPVQLLLCSENSQLLIQVIQGQDGWGVTYSSTEICAFKGSTVDMSCTYRYPSTVQRVENMFWFRTVQNENYVDLKNEPGYSGRVQYDCINKDCSLRITDLRESDSSEYKFMFITNQPDPDLQVKIQISSPESITSKFWFSPERSHQWQSPSQPEDLSDSQFAGRVQVLESERGRSTLRITDLTESDSAQYHFKFTTQWFEWRSSLPGATLTVTALQVQVTRITVHQSDTEAELKCHSSCSPAARLSYVWFKNGQKVTGVETSSFKGRVYPEDIISCALKGHENYGSPPVYGPRLPSVSVSPSAEIVEGSSVTLTCSSDANPAANYTWYKENGDPDLQPLSKDPQLVFSSIQSSDSGEYYCTAENQLGRRTSEYIYINVTYAPRLPSVSVSPSAEIVEGSSVTLTCSSDANPAANYTWYKENEDSPKASGQIFTITDIKAEHSGNYSCEAQNRRGTNKTTVHLTVLAVSWKSVAAGTITVVLLAIISLSVFLWIRIKRASRESTEAEERPDDREQGESEEQDDFHYASVHFSNNQADNLYSNIRPAQPRRHVEQQEVEYAAVRFNSASTAPRARGQGAAEDPAALYSTVNKTR